jgi:hypothetical protein
MQVNRNFRDAVLNSAVASTRWLHLAQQLL